MPKPHTQPQVFLDSFVCLSYNLYVYVQRSRNDETTCYTRNSNKPRKSCLIIATKFAEQIVYFIEKKHLMISNGLSNGRSTFGSGTIFQAGTNLYVGCGFGHTKIMHILCELSLISKRCIGYRESFRRKFVNEKKVGRLSCFG